MKKLVFAILLVVATPAQATECPKDVNPCKVVFLTPQQLEWLVGKQGGSASGSLLDTAVKAIGADAALPVFLVLQAVRNAQDGTPPVTPPQEPTK